MKNLNKSLINVIFIIVLISFSSLIKGDMLLDEKMTRILNTKGNRINEQLIINEKNTNKNIDELGFILYDLVRKKKFEEIDSILAQYIQDEKHDGNLVTYISAEKAIVKQDYNQAIKLYEKMLSQQPNIILIELKLANTYTKNKLYERSLKSYIEIKKKYKNKLLKEHITLIDSQIITIKKINSWQGRIRVGSSYNSNLNEAEGQSKSYCQVYCMQGAEVIAGTKWNYYAELSKRFPVFGNHSAYMTMGVLGVEPMKAISKPEIKTFIYGGYQFEKANRKIRLLPVVDTKWVDNQYRNHSLGAKVSSEYYLNDNVIFLADIELKNKQYHSDYKFNNGMKINYSLTGAYIINPNTMVFIRGHGINRNKKSASDSYQQYGMKLGLLKITGPLELLSAIGYKNTKFKQFDYHLDTKRKDNNWYMNTAISLPNKKILTFHPSIYFNYQLNSSTADVIYSFKQSEIGINFIKTF